MGLRVFRESSAMYRCIISIRSFISFIVLTGRWRRWVHFGEDVLRISDVGYFENLWHLVVCCLFASSSCRISLFNFLTYFYMVIILRSGFKSWPSAPMISWNLSWFIWGMWIVTPFRRHSINSFSQSKNIYWVFTLMLGMLQTPIPVKTKFLLSHFFEAGYRQ